MSILPRQLTPLGTLKAQGYDIRYIDSDSVSQFEQAPDCLDFNDSIKAMVMTGKRLADLGHEPPVRYIDKGTGNIFAVSWHEPNGFIGRRDAPSFLCDRHSGNGAGVGVHYQIEAHYRHGKPHNEHGNSLTIFDKNQNGEMIKTVEERHINGKRISAIERDPDSGKILNQYDSNAHEYLPSDLSP